jgi:hypothetical protein
MNEHAGNPSTGEAVPTPAPEPGIPAGTAVWPRWPPVPQPSDTRKIELVPFGLSEIPGVRTLVEKTSPMQRVFGAEA